MICDLLFVIFLDFGLGLSVLLHHACIVPITLSTVAQPAAVQQCYIFYFLSILFSFTNSCKAITSIEITAKQ